jgi:hypothetical protein
MFLRSYHSSLLAYKCRSAERRLISVYFPKKKVKARSLLCYWAVRAAEISLRTLSKRLRMSAPGVGYAVERGEAIVKEGNYELI